MNFRKTPLGGFVLVFGVLATNGAAYAQPGTVLSHQKISATQGGGPPLDINDQFGTSVALLGDLDGDGVSDLAVGAKWDDDDADGGSDSGAVWILFLNPDGTVKSHQKISSTQGNGPPITPVDNFGISVASLGDLDGDSIVDLAVGAFLDDDGVGGAVWVLFLNTNGTVKSHQKISDTQGGFTGILDAGDRFGFSLASLDDLDGDGVGELAVGASSDSDGGFLRGAVWILFLNTNGTVKSHQKINDTSGGFTGLLDDFDAFGFSVVSLGDLNGDGVSDLAVGAPGDDDGGNVQGAVWVLFLNSDGTVNSHQKISSTQGGGPPSGNGALKGTSLALLVDLDGDGVSDLATGGGDVVWILFLNIDGTVKSYQEISDTQGGFTGPEPLGARSLSSMGDLNRDGVADLIVGAALDGDGGGQKGAVWVLFLDGVSECPVVPEPLILFREAVDSAWGFGPDNIPGWDHVGFYINDTVYESHPGYETGAIKDCDGAPEFVKSYWDPCVNDFRCIDFKSGIQTFHTLSSFQHDTANTKTKAANESVVIDMALATAMQEFIEIEMTDPNIEFLNLCPPFDLGCWIETLNPLLQKGYTQVGQARFYTCVGLIERAAEEAGANLGAGFIPDEWETFFVPFYDDPIPMLSPWLLYEFLTGGFDLDDPNANSLMGYLDPVDFLITDPKGRRMGFTQADGELNEIPNAIFSGDGDVEQFIIFDPIPGDYIVELVGLGEQAEAAFGGTIEGQLFQGFLEVGETVEMTFTFPETCPADFDDSGDVGAFDLAVLLGAWGPCPEPCEAGDPATTCAEDLDGDCDVEAIDLALLLGSWGPCP